MTKLIGGAIQAPGKKRQVGAIIKVWNTAAQLYEVFSQRGYRFEWLEDDEGNLYGIDDLGEDVRELITGAIDVARKALDNLTGGIFTQYVGKVRVEKPREEKFLEKATMAQLRSLAQKLEVPYSDKSKVQLRNALKASGGVTVDVVKKARMEHSKAMAAKRRH